MARRKTKRRSIKKARTVSKGKYDKLVKKKKTKKRMTKKDADDSEQR